jgi:hypothetical protein
MKKAEIFALVVGIIGVVADILTIGTFVASWTREPQYGQPQMSASFAALVVVSLVYSWLIISWFLTHRSYSLWEEDVAPTIQWANYLSKRKWHARIFTQKMIASVCGTAIAFSLLVVTAFCVFSGGAHVTSDYIGSAIFAMAGSWICHLSTVDIYNAARLFRHGDRYFRRSWLSYQSFFLVWITLIVPLQATVESSS